MYKFCLLGVSAAVMAMAVSPAWADGAYVSLKGGVNRPADVDIGSGSGQRTATYENGYVMLGAVGVMRGPWRTELEIQNQQAEVKDLKTPAGAALADPQGQATLNAAMANLYYGFDVGNGWTPYIGGGLGIGSLKYDNYRSVSGVVIDDNTTALVYQGMLGLDYAFTDSWSLLGEYRYVATADVKSGNSLTGSNDSNFASHALMLGLTYRF